MQKISTKDIKTMRSEFETCTNPADILINLWDPLLDSEKELIRKNIDTKKFGKYDTIYKIGEMPLYIMYVLSGRVKICRNTDDGHAKIIRMFRENQFFGYRAFFAQECYTTNCFATSATKVATIPVNVIERLVDSNKTVMRFFFKELAKGLGMSDDRIVSLAQKHLRGRLAETLLFLSRSFGTDEDGWIHGTITRKDIADLANMTTSNAIRTMSAFRSEGIIEASGKKLRISKPQELLFISGKE